MQTKDGIKQRIDRIKLLIMYAVSEVERDRANALVDSYRENRVALSVLKEFYSCLPEAREESVSRIVHIDTRQGIFLLGVRAGVHEYIFVATEDDAMSLGEFQEDGGDEDTFGFFGYPGKASFLKRHPTMAEFKDFRAIYTTNTAFCPVCSAAVGEPHHLGCPVEICPWCFGQLSKCNCRFDQLGKEELAGDEELRRFESLLQEKGRICFEAGQGPAYPVAGKDMK